MDAFLSREARQSLEALCLIPSGPAPGGVLLGHKRDHRFIIEKVFPCPSHLFLAPEVFFELDSVFEGRVIGFFSFRSSSPKNILRPHGFGKLYLEVRRDSHNKMALKSFVIEREKRFILLPISLKFDEKGAKE